MAYLIIQGTKINYDENKVYKTLRGAGNETVIKPQIALGKRRRQEIKEQGGTLKETLENELRFLEVHVRYTRRNEIRAPFERTRGLYHEVLEALRKGPANRT
jgi:hypothetical protein